MPIPSYPQIYFHQNKPEVLNLTTCFYQQKCLKKWPSICSSPEDLKQKMVTLSTKKSLWLQLGNSWNAQPSESSANGYCIVGLGRLVVWIPEKWRPGLLRILQGTRETNPNQFTIFAGFSLGFCPPKALLVRLIVMLIPGLAVLMLCWAGYRIYTTGSSSDFFRVLQNSGGVCGTVVF